MKNRLKPRARRELFMEELEPLMDGLYRTALRFTRDATRADDVVQEAVLKAFRFFDSFKQGTNFRAWMYRVLYTVFVNTTREKSPQTSEPEYFQEAEADPSRRLIDELDRPTHAQRVAAVLESVDERLVHAIEDLPSDLRMVFILSTIEGLKYREIADVMGTPLGTVMSRLFRSRRMLQERLAEFAHDEGFHE